MLDVFHNLPFYLINDSIKKSQIKSFLVLRNIQVRKMFISNNLLFLQFRICLRGNVSEIGSTCSLHSEGGRKGRKSWKMTSRRLSAGSPASSPPRLASQVNKPCGVSVVMLNFCHFEHFAWMAMAFPSGSSEICI